MSYVVPIVAAVAALAGGALGAWWQARRASRDFDTRIAYLREQAREQIAHARVQAHSERQYAAKHEWYGRYDVVAGWVREAIMALQSQRRRNAGDPDGIDFGRSEDELVADVFWAAQELGVAADHLDLIAPREMMKKINEVSLQIGPAIGRDGLPAELHVPMQQIRDMMRTDLEADHL